MAEKKWTEEEIEFLKQNIQSMTFDKIGEKLGRTKASIDNKKRELGIKKNKNNTISKALQEYILLEIQHRTAKEIAKEIGIPDYAITKFLRNNGIFGHVAFTDHEIEFIQENYGKITAKEIGKKLNRQESVIVRKANELGLQSDLGKEAGYKTRKYEVNHDYFKTWSSNMAYILGFVVGDGWISKDMRQLCIRLSPTDINILEFIRSEIAPEVPIKIENGFDKRTRKETKSAVLRICSAKLVKYLYDTFGIIPAKTGAEVLPNVPGKYKADYARGFFEADGWLSVNKDKRDNSYSVIMGFAAGEQHMLDFRTDMCFGFGNLYYDQGTHNLHISQTEQVFKMIDFMYYSDDIYHMGRKRETCFNFKEMVLNRSDLSNTKWKSWEDEVLLANYDKGFDELERLLKRNKNAIRQRYNKIR